MKMISKILKIASYCLFGLIIAMSVFVVSLRFLGESTSIFGYSFYYVLTESMEPEIMAGEIIVGEEIEPENLKVGDVVTYMGREGALLDKVITHKIILIEDGIITTQGVANITPDPPIEASQIMSKYVTTVPLAGKLFSLINSRFGFIAFIAIPLGLLIVNEVSIIVKAFKEDKEEHLSE